MVLSAQTPWHVVCLTSALAIVSKYLVRTRAGNVFNPAALAIVALYPVFHAGQSWWGALPEVAPVVQVLLVVTGVFIADRVNRMPLVLAFLGSYYLLFTVTAFVSDPAWVSEVFRAPDWRRCCSSRSSSSPIRPPRLSSMPISCCLRVLVAVVSFAIFEWTGGGLLPAGRRARRQCLGGLAPGESTNRSRVPSRDRWLSARAHTVESLVACHGPADHTLRSVIPSIATCTVPSRCSRDSFGRVCFNRSIAASSSRRWRR